MAKYRLTKSDLEELQEIGDNRDEIIEIYELSDSENYYNGMVYELSKVHYEKFNVLLVKFGKQKDSMKNDLEKRLFSEALEKVIEDISNGKIRAMENAGRKHTPNTQRISIDELYTN